MGALEPQNPEGGVGMAGIVAGYGIGLWDRTEVLMGEGQSRAGGEQVECSGQTSAGRGWITGST